MQLKKPSASLAISSLFSLVSMAPPAATAVEAAHNVPKSVSVSTDLGRLNPATTMKVTVHLNMRDEAAFTKAVDALYDPSSPTFHHWMTDKDLKQYAPTADKLEAVRKELEAHGLTILSVGLNGTSVRAQGTVGNVESAFGTEIHQFERNGEAFRANVKDSHLSGPAGDYVSSVAGIVNHQIRPMVKLAINPKTGQPFAAVPMSQVAQADGFLEMFITDEMFSSPKTFTLDTPGAALPVATYSGKVYQKNPDLQSSFTPQQLQTIYGLPEAYAKGLDGTGQTIVLLEAFGYPTLEDDANAFFGVAGLSQLTSANFRVVYPEGPPSSPDLGIQTGWNLEMALDLQWAHAIAPGANIIVVVAPGQDGESFEAAMEHIVNLNLGYQVSNSWEEDIDGNASSDEVQSYEDILIVAAAKGISFQFSSGDDGDHGFGTPVGASGVPSDAPHATGVGGTSILNLKAGYTSVGWGNAQTTLANASGPVDPPTSSFAGGGGGGESVWFLKPRFQQGHGLPGTGRQSPDVSMLGDEHTGVPIALTDPASGNIFLHTGVGGTSLSSPLFTALWAICNQNAGASLGQAARAVAPLQPGQIVDVVPLTSNINVSGTITDSSGTTAYSPSDLFAGQLYGTTKFISAMWFGSTALAFGLDSSLTVTRGWDNVTGFGTPNGMAFIDGVAGK